MSTDAPHDRPDCRFCRADVSRRDPKAELLTSLNTLVDRGAATIDAIAVAVAREGQAG